MKLKALITCLLANILVGCGGTNPRTTVQPAQAQAQAQAPAPAPTPAQKPTTEPTKTPAQPQVSVGEAAKLSPTQVEQLLALSKNNAKGMNFRIIVPTYIPAGFEVDSLEILDEPDRPFAKTQYILKYRNHNNFCFYIEGYHGPVGHAPSYHHTIEVDSPALGKVILEITYFDKVSTYAYTIGLLKQDEQTFQLWHFYTCDETINIEEAIKMVQSFQDLK
ncbi:hypothetical protein [Kamptonema formosum]|uniref:hypothetical protein n=1 Tax=Kamptonema formosum TaxID=331992 RepID=UPI0003462DB4|nr:hypothetical protein [Oscillatoria sp. PCC 10802]